MDEMKKLDHIVYCTPDLYQGIQLIEGLTGVQPRIGGRHLTKGTHNALLPIGPFCYLEILAPDPANWDIGSPRWMGIDLLERPCISRWSIRTDQLASRFQEFREIIPSLGVIEEGTRKLNDGTTLKWSLTDPGVRPAISTIPFLIDWENSPHPASDLELKCQISEITLHQSNDVLPESVLNDLDIPVKQAHSDWPCISIQLDTPNGVVRLT